MDAQWVALIVKLVETLLPILAEWLKGALAGLAHAGLDTNTDFQGVVAAVVEGIARDHPDWSDEQRRTTAREAIQRYARTCGPEISDSLTNLTIELHVQALKARDRA